ncbi:phasin family protein [Sphingomonas sp.]|uniref:phasin family protein n=1 Tax=Sphingomonas sp. TaxID=28214 RepID=UPI00183E8CB0|nr:phasin family protein [Sphingomonas sp.]MBA3512012.1 phasin family protein [Sphingomonas sp.]
MVDQNKIQADAAAEAPAKVAKAVAATVETVATETAKTAKRARAASKRRTKRASRKAAPAMARKASRSKARTSRTARTAAARKPAAAASTQRIQDMNFTPNTAFPGFGAFTGATPFQSLFADAGERSQEAAKRSQKVGQELADIARANVEAVVEATRVATEGARSIGQDAVARSRDGAEQTADAIRSLAEAKSPTEFVQLQSEIAKTSFDRMVAESSRLTESMVKLAGQAFQPLSNRATANAERINNLVA